MTITNSTFKEGIGAVLMAFTKQVVQPITHQQQTANVVDGLYAIATALEKLAVVWEKQITNDAQIAQLMTGEQGSEH